MAKRVAPLDQDQAKEQPRLAYDMSKVKRQQEVTANNIIDEVVEWAVKATRNVDRPK